MKRTAVVAVILLGALSAVAFVGGCSDDSSGPSGGKSPYGDLTEKEHCITNLVVSHELSNISRYAEILHSNYILFGMKWGLFGDEIGTLDYSEDIDVTEQLFRASMVHLDIGDGAWSAMSEVAGDPCADCWETTREYRFEAYFPADEVTYISTNIIKLIVVPIDDNGTKRYNIRLVYDISI